MPLSENEQRILQEIEKSFYENDPAFARAVTGNGFPRAGLYAKLAAFSFVVFLGLLLFSFTKIPLVGFACFLGMVLSAAVFVKNIRRVLRPKLYNAQREASFEAFRNRWRNRFHGDED